MDGIASLTRRLRLADARTLRTHDRRRVVSSRRRGHICLHPCAPGGVEVSITSAGGGAVPCSKRRLGAAAGVTSGVAPPFPRSGSVTDADEADPGAEPRAEASTPRGRSIPDPPREPRSSGGRWRLPSPRRFREECPDPRLLRSSSSSTATLSRSSSTARWASAAARRAFARLFEIASELRGESVRLRRRRGAFRRERLHATFRRREAPSKFPLYRSRTRGFLALRRERLARVREFLRRARQILRGLLQRRGFLLEAFLKRVRSSARLARHRRLRLEKSPRRRHRVVLRVHRLARHLDARSICARAWSLDRENSSATDANEDARRALEPTNQAAGPDAAGRDRNQTRNQTLTPSPRARNAPAKRPNERRKPTPTEASNRPLTPTTGGVRGRGVRERARGGGDEDGGGQGL